MEKRTRTLCRLTFVVIMMLAVAAALWVGGAGLSGCSSPGGAAVVRSIEVGASTGESTYTPSGAGDARSWNSWSFFGSVHPFAGAGLKAVALEQAHASLRLARAMQEAQNVEVEPAAEPEPEPEPESEPKPEAAGTDKTPPPPPADRRWYENAAFLAWLGAIIMAAIAAWQGKRRGWYGAKKNAKACDDVHLKSEGL